MRIVVEGPDGSGKTTLVDKLAKHYHLNKVVFHQAAPKSYDDYMQYLKLDNIILERSFMSEMVYPEVFMRKHVLTNYEYNKLLSAYKEDCIIIMMNASPEVLTDRLLKRGDEEEVVLRRIKYISNKYSSITQKLEVPEFNIGDWDKILDYIEWQHKEKSKRPLSSYLKKGAKAAMLDGSLFSKYEDKSISIGRAIHEFKRNNEIPAKVVITPEELIEYMASVGYYRE